MSVCVAGESLDEDRNLKFCLENLEVGMAVLPPNPTCLHCLFLYAARVEPVILCWGCCEELGTSYPIVNLARGQSQWGPPFQGV